MIAYWAAGQRRVVREARDRLAERYIAARDASISADVLVGRVKARGDHVPSYARPAKPAKSLAQLLADNPGSVTREPLEFRN